MADLHDTFIDFNDNVIKLSGSRKKKLRTSRNSVRKDIEKYFKEKRDKHKYKPKGQGSFLMNTMILPLDGDYDVDDGVYIFGSLEDRPSVDTAHNWIVEATKGRTSEDPMDKNTCVRVRYATDYHVDLPIYYKVKESSDESTLDTTDIPKLAHKAKGWIDSDPYEFFLWFKDAAKGKPQLKRIVRYLKAWTDNKKSYNLPSGMVMTILVVNNFVSKEDRDDKSLLETLEGIQLEIDDTRFETASYICKRPTVDKEENLLDKYSTDITKTNFLDSLNRFIESGRQAIEKRSKKEACIKWQKHLGDRFPCKNIIESDEDLATIFKASDIIKNDNKSGL